MNNPKALLAIENFENGMNCAQSVISVFANDHGLDLSVALKLTSTLGGGIGRKQEICGAINAGVLGLMYGNQSPNDKESKEQTSVLAQQFLTKMEKEFGGLTCRHVLGASLETPYDREKVGEQNLTKIRCNPCIARVVSILGQLEESKTSSIRQNK
ncbi:C-GCAxxG-C-C family protein [Williamwhitmania taraxaci]|uniref:C_GCAxxG_C_C family probable redox protein n=1 Tax=Williamwhitmania taraxaci TaxID=1640674 RepID=A0A1G6J9P6_9BACT|nr:C-GCAxxG-C-C family protein [Williamwhitmania taraxaci]SDC15343.1 C_GCAxxG_C_C family probable redox protein [Williamwhitmania taraxaci]